MDPDDPTFGDALELTYEGVRTAKKLGVMLKEFADSVQFASSPLTRTRMTAECIAEGMDVVDPEIPTDELLGNGSFYYDDPAEVLEVFKPKNFFPACIEYFHTAHQRGFRDLYAATDEFEKWIDVRWKSRLFVISTHDLYIAAFLYARKVGEFSRRTGRGSSTEGRSSTWRTGSGVTRLSGRGSRRESSACTVRRYPASCSTSAG